MDGSLVFALLVPVLAFALLLGVVTRKAARDLTELRSGRRRDELLELEGDRLTIAVLDALRGGLWTQADLLQVLRRASPNRHEAIVAAARTAETDRLISGGRNARSAAARGRSLLLGAWLRHPGAVAAALGGLKDRDGDVRLAACGALGASRTPEAARALVGALEADVAPAPRLIERLAHPWAVGPLLAALPDVQPGRARAGCLRALGLAGDPVAAHDVARYASSPEVEERISAVRALGELGDAATWPAVTMALHDERWEVRAQAATALGKIGVRFSASALEQALTDPAWWVRANAAKSLGKLGPVGEDALRRALDGPDRYAADRAREELHLLDAQAA